MVKVAYTVGRFQPPTIGHKALIQKVIDTAGPGGKAYVFVSSTMTPKNINPLTSEQKMPILQHMFPSGVEFVDTAKCGYEWEKSCGGGKNAFEYLVGARGHKPEEITLVVGDDRKPVFGPEAGAWNRKNDKGEALPPLGPGGSPPKASNFVFLSSARRNPDPNVKDAANMSGTKARGYVKDGRKDDFYIAVGYDGAANKAAADAVYGAITDWLKSKGGRRRRGGAFDDESAFDADDEPGSGGRRRTRRRKVGTSRRARH